MRICIISKFPPIQGGVSMRTYWTAHALAARGHEVHVITNAKEARPPFRMHMRPEDWTRCEAQFDTGSVTVHWTDPVDRSQSYIPMASPFVSKLSSIAARVHSERPFDVIFSHYMEPYGIAAHLTAEMTERPHVVRMAGSDAGRLWHHPQFEALYDHVLRSAEIVIAAGAVAERAIERGVHPDRVVIAGGYRLPENLFTPEGPHLELERLRIEVNGNAEQRHAFWGEFIGDRPYFGIYGKLGESKGSFALVSAIHRLKLMGIEVGLVALAHGKPHVERSFRERAHELGLVDRILQIPYLPHWRVPEFLRGCLAVCCLEQDFPIALHTPITPREVLLCGACLVGSTEVIRKLPRWERLPDGYGCVAVENVNEIEALSKRLAAIAHDPTLAPVVGQRGRDFARELQREIKFPHWLERILAAAVGTEPLPRSMIFRPSASFEAEPATSRFPLTRIVVEAMGANRSGEAASLTPAETPIDLAHAQRILIDLERAIEKGEMCLRPLARAVQAEIAVAHAESNAPAAAAGDPLFRAKLQRWAIGSSDLAGLVPLREPNLRLLRFEYDVSQFRGVRTVADFPSAADSRPSFLVVFARCDEGSREPLAVDSVTAGILELSDGTRTVSEILTQLGDESGFSTLADGIQWIEGLFVRGLVRFQNSKEKWQRRGTNFRLSAI